MAGSDRSKATPGISTRSKKPFSIAGGPKVQVGNCSTIASARLLAQHRIEFLRIEVEQIDEASVSLLRDAARARPVTVHDKGRAITFDVARTAMIVVDMQNDFCHPDGWLAHIGVDVAAAGDAIAGLSALLPGLRAAGVPVLWVNCGNRPDRMNLSPALLHVYNPTGAGVGIGDPLHLAGLLPGRDALQRPPVLRIRHRRAGAAQGAEGDMNAGSRRAWSAYDTPSLRRWRAMSAMAASAIPITAKDTRVVTAPSA